MGRKKIEIDYSQLENLRSIQCTDDEICSVLGVCKRTFEYRKKTDPEFKRAYDSGIEKGKASLRRLQYQLAQEGNPTMLIWLGKQYLGQSDKQEIKTDVKVKREASEFTDDELASIIQGRGSRGIIKSPISPQSLN